MTSLGGRFWCCMWHEQTERGEPAIGEEGPGTKRTTSPTERECFIGTEMGTKSEIPLYKSGKTYVQFKKKISTWRLVTELKPEDDNFKIWEKIFEEINVEDLNKEGGLDT
ncbi:hypothetical protein SK128_007523 [Halocaridina rubra]|uniref:Uncharacterized protein n=1 Tax=Halocaridina rubra TaxID=373956 RepID=A0AAN8X5H8_HALRR